jgi:predicted flap endonuclease-1-like 5' DNA nuclease
MSRLSDIEGISPSQYEKLKALGITTTKRLLLVAAGKPGREDLASQTGISEKSLLKWLNVADLMRVKGIGQEYSELLEAAGVDSVVDLRRRRPETLYQAMTQVNGKKKVVRRLPAMVEVKRWIKAAQSVTPKVS